MPGIGAIAGFFLGPVGRWVALGLALAAWTIYQRDQAADKARQECQAEQIQKVLDETRRQRDAAQQALADAEKQQTVTDNEMAKLESERDAIIKSTGPSCTLSDDVRKRLRNIR